MAKLTTRDVIHSVALVVARKKSGRRSWREPFSVGDVVDHIATHPVDVDPSGRTVADTLASMATLGDLEEGDHPGTYLAPEWMLGADSAASSAESGPSGDAGTDEGASTADRRDERARDQEDVVDVDQEDGPLADLEVPGEGQLAERRRDAARAAVAYVREHGGASRSELVESVYPDHPAGYQKPLGAWWQNVVRPALKAVDSVADSGGRWVHLDGSDDS